MGLGFLLGSSTDFLGALIPIDGGSFRGFAVAILAVVPWAATLLAISGVRSSRFRRFEVPKIQAAVQPLAPAG
jgi:hypothetical protein